ncbi:hypothetical protein VCR12J2_50003 [Vibrio coralliirubri]|nr:hypothetical protein VCR12J2_50003 [Vibrio coralliirubri]
MQTRHSTKLKITGETKSLLLTKPRETGLHLNIQRSINTHQHPVDIYSLFSQQLHF